MRILTIVVIMLLSSTVTLAQVHSVESKDDKSKQEIQKLFTDLNEAILKKDRAALERAYADEFQFVRPSGAVITKSAQIDGVMSNDPLSSTPVATPAPDRMMVYGDVVILRNMVRGTAISSIIGATKAQMISISFVLSVAQLLGCRLLRVSLENEADVVPRFVVGRNLVSVLHYRTLAGVVSSQR